MSEKPIINVIYQESKPSEPGIDLIAWLKIVAFFMVLFGLMNICSWLV